MAKGHNPFGGGGMPNMAGLMKQAQKMQEEAQRIQDEIAAARFDATSGGGMVTAVVSGKGNIVDLKIDPQCVDPEDIEMLQDLVVSAVREAQEKAEAAEQSKMADLTGGINFPGLF